MAHVGYLRRIEELAQGLRKSYRRDSQDFLDAKKDLDAKKGTPEETAAERRYNSLSQRREQHARDVHELWELVQRAGLRLASANAFISWRGPWHGLRDFLWDAAEDELKTIEEDARANIPTIPAAAGSGKEAAGTVTTAGPPEQGEANGGAGSTPMADPQTKGEIMADAAKYSLADLLRDLRNWEVTCSLAKQANDQCKDPVPAHLKGLPSYQLDYQGFLLGYVRQASEFRNAAAKIEREIDAKPGVERHKTFCRARREPWNADTLEMFCAQAAERESSTLAEFLQRDVSAGFFQWDVAAGVAEWVTGTPSPAATLEENKVNGGVRAVDSPDRSLAGSRMTKVFVSYAHSSREHMQTVSTLVKTLRANGLIVSVDTDVKTPQGPEEGWPRWMKRQIKEADWVLMFFDELYRRRFDGEEQADKGLGATWEGAIITHHYYRNSAKNEKFIPLLADGAGTDLIPDELFGYTRYSIPSQTIELAAKLRPPNLSERKIPVTKPGPPSPEPEAGEGTSGAGSTRTVVPTTEGGEIRGDERPIAHHMVDVRGELRELQTLFRSAADRCPQLRGAFILDKDGKILVFSIGRPPNHFDGQIVVLGVPKDEDSVLHDLMMLCRRAGLVLRHCFRAFPQPNDAAMRDLLRADGEPEARWIGFLCNKMRPDLSVRVTEERGQKITRAWFDGLADVSARAVAWLTNRWLLYASNDPSKGERTDWAGSGVLDPAAAPAAAKLEPAAQTTTASVSPSPPRGDENLYLSPADMANRYKVPRGALESRLKRWRKGHGDGWKQVTDPKPREPRYLYHVCAVWSVIQGLAKTTGERPAK